MNAKIDLDSLVTRKANPDRRVFEVGTVFTDGDIRKIAIELLRVASQLESGELTAAAVTRCQGGVCPLQRVANVTSKKGWKHWTDVCLIHLEAFKVYSVADDIDTVQKTERLIAALNNLAGRLLRSYAAFPDGVVHGPPHGFLNNESRAPSEPHTVSAP